MDPIYPLVPVVSFISAFLTLLTILTSVRQSWNTGVLMLCMWLFIFCLIQGFETIIWSDDADDKAPVWCDISSRIGLGVGTGVPACSLVITRRLSNIARLKSVEPPTKRKKRIQYSLDIFIGVVFPIIVMGPFYYVVQAYRFEIYEETGCASVEVSSGLATILTDIWQVILPFISAVFYCPRILWTFYRHCREVNAFPHSNGSVNRARYFRILAVGCLDILFTLPCGALFLLVDVAQGVSSGYYPFYPGWYYTHHPWAPVYVSAAEWRSDFWNRFDIIYSQLLYPVLSIMIFTLFGLTGEARATYGRWFWAGAGLFGFEPAVREDMPDMKFDGPPQRRRIRAPGHSLSLLESSVMDGTDFTISMPATRPQDEDVSHVDTANEIEEVEHEEGEGRPRHSLDAYAQRAQLHDEGWELVGKVGEAV